MTDLVSFAQIPDIYVVDPPAEEPVSLDEIKAELGVYGTARDTQLRRLIRGGREFVEHETGLALVGQTLEKRFDIWPESRALELRGPIIGTVMLYYTDADGALTEVPADDYIPEIRQKYPRIVQANSVTWPDSLAISDSIRVQWRAGFAERTGSPLDSLDKIPANLVSAIILHAEAHFDKDERTMQKYIEAATALCSASRVRYGFA